MMNTFRYVLLSLVRNKGILIWALAFPIVLSCCFMLMFQGLDDMADASTVRTLVVEDASWDEAPALPQYIEAIEEGDDAILEVTAVSTEQEALRRAEEAAGTDDPFVGYLTADEDGLPVVHLIGTPQGTAASMTSVYQAILVRLMDIFCSKSEMVAEITRTDPMLLADPSAIEALFETRDATEKVDVTENAPKESVRFYFALLGMAALFGAQSALIAVSALLPNTSALGARRTLGGISRPRALAGCIFASWTMSFACLTVAYLFMRFVAGVDFGGRDLACLGVLAIASLMATALGALIGSIPKIPAGAKSGMLTGIVCFASLFAGLYGQPTMELADSVAAACPASQYVNPAVQVSQAMFSLMYYDSLGPCLQNVLVMLVMAALFFLLSIRFLGRQRYASI